MREEKDLEIEGDLIKYFRIFNKMSFLIKLIKIQVQILEKILTKVNQLTLLGHSLILFKTLNQT